MPRKYWSLIVKIFHFQYIHVHNQHFQTPQNQLNGAGTVSKFDVFSHFRQNFLGSVGQKMIFCPISHKENGNSKGLSGKHEILVQIPLSRKLLWIGGFKARASWKPETQFLFYENYCKNPKNSNTQKIYCNHPKISSKWLCHRAMHPQNADGIANSVDPDQTALCPDLTFFYSSFASFCCCSAYLPGTILGVNLICT